LFIGEGDRRLDTNEGLFPAELRDAFHFFQMGFVDWDCLNRTHLLLFFDILVKEMQGAIFVTFSGQKTVKTVSSKDSRLYLSEFFDEILSIDILLEVHKF